MWKTGFPYIRAEKAVLSGYTRAMCIKSVHYRGTPDHPGLVMGLDTGGECTGVAFQVDDAAWPDTVAYLRARELVTNVYLEQISPIALQTGETVDAYVFVADTSHPQYAGDWPLPEKLHAICTAKGLGGTTWEYLANTVAHLIDIDMEDKTLTNLLAAAKRHAAE
jgi:cation transport protein ChaC